MTHFDYKGSVRLKQYKVVEMLDPLTHEFECKLNELAKEGWELVSTNFWNSYTDAILIVVCKENRN